MARETVRFCAAHAQQLSAIIDGLDAQRRAHALFAHALPTARQ